jgi:hypothetical protein
LRVPAFIAANYAWPGAVALNRPAFGRDILVAPFNFLMGFPNFVIQLTAMLLGLVGFRRAAKGLARTHLGLPTAVQQAVHDRLMVELLQLPRHQLAPGEGLRQRIRTAADEPARIYVQTRNVAADITAGTLAALVGLALLQQFTPGSISAGAALAQVVAREQAASGFVFGETLGELYYAVVPVSPSLPVLAGVFVAVALTIAIVAAVSGIVHDPIQAVTGIHRRRLNRLLDAIEQAASAGGGDGYRPRDTFFGRVYDLVDWVKGLLTF